MKCPNCHNEVADSLLVCPICFTKVHDNSPNTLIQHPVQSTEVNNGGAPVQRVVVKTINTNNQVVNKPQVIQTEVKTTEEVKEEVVPQVSEKTEVLEIPPIEEINKEENKDTKVKKIKLIRRKSDYFFLGVIIVGCIVLIGFVISLFVKDDVKESKKTTTTRMTTTVVPGEPTENIGIRSNFNYPSKAGNTTIASLYDIEKGKYTDVDITGVKYYTGEDANTLAATYAVEPLNPGFEWIGFEYKVKLNDLNYLGDRMISPVLTAKIYKWNGCEFAHHNGKNYILNVVSIYNGGNIKNKQSANVKVLYQMPIGMNDYSLCFGNIDETLGCFSK